MKIAIIGSGIAGLASAYYLRNHDCELYEAKPFLSLAGHGMELENGSVIDIPLRVIHPQYYPNLLNLCREIQIPLRKLEHSGSFALSRVQESFDYFSIPIFKKRYNFIKPTIKHLRVGAEFMRFYFLCHKFKDDEKYEEVNFGEFLEENKVSQKLREMILYPLLSSICTCNYEELDAFPARILIEMMSMIAGPVPMERFYAGTHDIEAGLTKHLGKIHLSSKVENIKILENGAELTINGETKKFDHIVIATEAHLISEILEENKYTKNVLNKLNTIPYKSTDTVIHTVADNNQQVLGEKSLHYQEHPPGGEAQATMWLNKVEPRLNLDKQTMQTWNPYKKRVKNEIRRSSLNRALMTVESYKAVKKLQGFSHPSFSLAGSYLAKGVPLLEGGVESAIYLSNEIERDRILS